MVKRSPPIKLIGVINAVGAIHTFHHYPLRFSKIVPFTGDRHTVSMDWATTTFMAPALSAPSISEADNSISPSPFLLEQRQHGIPFDCRKVCRVAFVPGGRCILGGSQYFDCGYRGALRSTGSPERDCCKLPLFGGSLSGPETADRPTANGVAIVSRDCPAFGDLCPSALFRPLY